MLRTRPDLIAVQDGFHARWLPAVLEQGYRRVGKGQYFVWWASTDLPEQVLRQHAPCQRRGESDCGMIRDDDAARGCRVSAEDDARPHRLLLLGRDPRLQQRGIVAETVKRVVEVFEGAGLRYEIVLVNDGSPDRSWSVISEIARTTPHVVALNLLKNYGQHHANLAGFMESTGDYVITMDDDLQNPPDQALLLIDAALQGHDVVFGEFEPQAGGRLPPARQQADQCDQPPGLRPARRPRRLQLPDPAPRRGRPDLRLAHRPPLRHRAGAALLQQPRQRHRPPRGARRSARAATRWSGSCAWC